MSSIVLQPNAVEVPSISSHIKKASQIGAVESVKAASDIYAPVSGTVMEVNAKLESEPSLLNTSPYEEGWIAKIKLDDVSEFEALMDHEAYKKHTAE